MAIEIGSTGGYAIEVRVTPTYATTGGVPVNPVYVCIERAPDVAGSPGTSAISRIATLVSAQPTTAVYYTNWLPNDGLRRHYRAYETRNYPFKPSADTGWVSAKPQISIE